MKTKLHKFVIHMSKLGICILILLLSLTMALASEIKAQRKMLDEIFIELSLSEGEESLIQVFKSIEAHTEFNFAYSRSDIRNKTVLLESKTWNLDDLLKSISVQARVSFKRVNEQIGVSTVDSSEKLPQLEDKIIAPISVQGKVTDENGEPLPGATVMEKGTSNGTITNVDGSFQLTVAEQAVLQISFVGYKSQEVVVGDDQEVINVNLAPDLGQLEEVVVIGYGAVKKADLTGSVSQIKTEELEAVPVYNVEQALKARAAGVRVTQNSGAPGGRIEVRIRGGNSMIGSNQPLYVVDGFPVTGGIDFLNPSDIASIDILKDASATAIYGSRGANGVVIITTKSGSGAGDGKISINTFFGVQEDVNRYELLDAREYAIVANEWLRNDGQDAFFDVNTINGRGTDWQEEIFRSAPIQNHTLTFSGSSDKTTYSLSGNYFDQEGIIINTGVKKGTFRLNLNHDAKSWLKVSTNLNLSRRDRSSVPVNNGNYGGHSILAAAVSAAPTLSIYDENGLPVQVGQEYIWGEATMQNPLIYAEPYKDRSFSNSFIGNVSFQIQLSDKLSFKSLYGMEYDEYTSESFTPIIYPNDRGYAYEGNSYRSSMLNENVLSYTTEIGDAHDLNVIGGFTYQDNFSRYSNISVNGFANNTTENFDLSSAETINPPSSGNSEWALLSWLGRANYSLADKYLFTFSVRADGSSRFGAENKWGVFPSGAFAWRVSDEGFMQGIEQISELKLRTSYGVTGNTALSPYQSLNRLSSVTAVLGNQTNVIGYVPVSIANPDLKWETTSQIDIGIDLNFFDNRLRFTADYYKKNTTDLLASVPLPPSSGFGSILKNIGEIENKGFEFLASADILDQELRWTLTGNISTNRNKIVELSEGNDIYGDQLNLFRSSLNIAREGEAFGMLYGLREDGLDEDGFIKYVDMNDDGSINQEDRVIIGNPYPDFIYGVSTDLSYKGFDLNLFFEGSYGNDIFWATAGTHLNSFQRGNNQFADLIGNYWTEENPDPNAKYPKISSATLVDVSERFVMDGSYMRLKSLKLAYNIPVEKIGWTFINNLQVYISGNNLFTITNYPGTDPEANTTGTDDQNVGSRLRVGIDQSAYPSAKVYATGFKLTF